MHTEHYDTVHFSTLTCNSLHLQLYEFGRTKFRTANYFSTWVELDRLQKRTDCLRIVLQQRQSQKEQHASSLSCRRPAVPLCSAPLMCNRIQMKSSRRHLLLKIFQGFFFLYNHISDIGVCAWHVQLYVFLSMSYISWSQKKQPVIFSPAGNVIARATKGNQ